MLSHQFNIVCFTEQWISEAELERYTVLSGTNGYKWFLGISATCNLQVSRFDFTLATPNTATCLDDIIPNVEGGISENEAYLSDYSVQEFISLCHSQTVKYRKI